ncbi:MAG: hypothetical protein ACLRWT_12725 [Agathobacter rectalis]
MVTITRTDDKYFMTVDQNKPVELEVKQPKGWEPTLMLPENPTNRKLINKAVADKKLDENPDGFELTVKAAYVPGQTTSLAVPNKKLIEYLSDAEKEEYMAIIERARQAYEAAKVKPMTEKEKLEAKIAKLQAQIAAMDEVKKEK